jgi:hypothetical protein
MEARGCFPAIAADDSLVFASLLLSYASRPFRDGRKGSGSAVAVKVYLGHRTHPSGLPNACFSPVRTQC